ncbi:MAG: hypothetical protein ABSB91_07065 [Sedimentisphaerales bacterium]
MRNSIRAAIQTRKKDGQEALCSSAALYPELACPRMLLSGVEGVEPHHRVKAEKPLDNAPLDNARDFAGQAKARRGRDVY